MTMAELTRERLQELRRIAEAATPGPLTMHLCDDARYAAFVDAPHLGPDAPELAVFLIERDARFFAEFDRDTVLALLVRIEALEQERDAALGEVEKLRSVIRDLLPIAEARVAWEEEYENDALSSTSWIEPKRRVIARAKEVLMRVGGGDGPSRQDQAPTA